MNRYVIFVAFTTIPLIMHYLMKRRYRKLSAKLKSEVENNKYYYDAIFLNMQNFYCRDHVLTKVECSEYCSWSQIKRIIKFIASAKFSISMCMMMFTINDIAVELIKARQKGVAVRVILDKSMKENHSSRVEVLKRYKIPYKFQHYEDTMVHHKFCLIDEYYKNLAKMFFGSLNLTNQAFIYNFEHVTLTNNWEMIREFTEEFEEMWQDF